MNLSVPDMMKINKGGVALLQVAELQTLRAAWSTLLYACKYKENADRELMAKRVRLS